MRVFLGGTVGESKWRDYVMPRLEVDYFNPVVPDWNDEAWAREIYERKTCDYVLYVLSPKMEGYYSIAEVADDSYKRPDRTILCNLFNDDGAVFESHRKAELQKVAKLVISNGGTVLETLDDIVEFLNSANNRQKSFLAKSEEMKDVFISYGRRHSLAFARKLHDKLVAEGKKVWFDMNDIPLAVDFQEQIDQGIEQADNVLYVISPHSVKSEYCLKELVLALKYNKRIIPILHVEPSDCWDMLHSEIGKRNWIYFRQIEDFSKPLEEWKSVDDFETAFQGLLSVINSHKDYMRMHTLLLNSALEWQRNHNVTNRLLVGSDRKRAEEWLLTEEFKDAKTGKRVQQPTTPNDLTAEYIVASKKNANNLYTDAYVSYSTAETDLQNKIINALAHKNITTWIHSRDIEKGADFYEAIKDGVQQANNFLYFISNEAVESENSNIELKYAMEYNKRIIPVLLEKTDSKKIPDIIKKLQYIDFSSVADEAEETTTIKNFDMQKRVELDVNYRKEKNRFQTRIDELYSILQKEAIYYERHKMYLVQALKWKEQNMNESILLRGYALEDARQWLDYGKNMPHQPLEIHRLFITTSQAKIGMLNTDVFISYSRKDGDFARKLNENLQLSGKNTWFDQESIAASANFQIEIYKGIANADNFLFIISADSVSSKYCEDEVGYASLLNKRMVTIYLSETPLEKIPEELKNVQWIDFQKRNFNSAYSELLRTLDLDRDYVRQHTKYAQLAGEWETKKRDTDLLLRGKEAFLAENWLREAFAIKEEPSNEQKLDVENLTTEKTPPPTRLQIDFILESRKAVFAEREKELAESRKKQRTKVAIISITAAIVIFFMSLTIFLVLKEKVKVEQEKKNVEEQKQLLESQKDSISVLLAKLIEKTQQEVILKYDKFINEATTHQEVAEFSEAIEKYQQALEVVRGYEVDSSAAVNGIKTCETLIAASGDFGRLIDEGNSLFSRSTNNDKLLLEALNKYKEAKATTFDDNLAQSKINKTTTEINKRFNDYKQRGLQALALGNAPGKQRAKQLFEKALILKPNDSFIVQKIKECE